jgi:hypothetical protein
MAACHPPSFSWPVEPELQVTLLPAGTAEKKLMAKKEDREKAKKKTGKS